MIKKNFFLIFLWFLWLELSVLVPYVKPNPFQNVDSKYAKNSLKEKDDFTTDYARQIVRLSKTADIKSNMNTKVDPCNDFYQYSCGNWHHNNPAQLFSQIMTDKFQEVSKSFDRRLLTLLNEPENDNEIGNKVKTFYRACKISRSDKTEYELSLRKVHEEFGEMPVLAGDTWNETNFKWWEIIANIQNKYGKEILFSVDIMGDIKNKSQTRVYLGPPNYDLSQGTTFINFLQEAQIYLNLQEHLGVEKKLAEKTAKELIAFEIKLTKSGTDERLGLGIEDMLSLQNVETLSATYKDHLDIKRFLSLVLGEEPPESIYIFDEKYLHNALTLIESTPKNIVANYVFWELLKEFLVDKEKDMSSWCLGKTKSHFGKFIDNWVYQYYRSPEAEADIFELFEEIRDAFRSALRGNKLDWISNNTREFAISKLDAIKIMINSYSNENFTADYANLQLTPYHYMENVKHILRMESQKNIHKLSEVNTSIPEDPTVMAFTPTYNVLENNIKIPVAFVQPRHFWSNEYPRAIKYATLGYLIAHELIHGFDDVGRKFDLNGHEYTWWDPRSTYEFEERRKCFQAQYHHYKYGGKTLPESVSQSENIADNAGIKLAYAAYMHYINKQLEIDPDIESKETLPELAFNNRQLFFICFAQVWCEDVQSWFKTTVASSDQHAPGMYRIIGSLSNFQEFSWVFKCAQDAKMDPEYKCSIY